MNRCLVVLCLLLPLPASAIDPGTATGRYRSDKGELRLAHAIALLRGNEEGLLDRARVMRVVLSDVEVQPQALEGIAFLPVGDLAKAGKVRGLLLEFDPADRTAWTITVLDKPQDVPPGHFATLPVITQSNSAGLWRKLQISDTRILGDIDTTSDGRGLAVSFSAPVFNSKLTADLKGKAAQASEQVKVLIAQAEAIARGDAAAAKALASARRRAMLDALPVDFWAGARQQAPQMLAAYRAINRVVVRGNTAVALHPSQGSHSLVVENGKWVVD